jgi:hypothetical protein
VFEGSALVALGGALRRRAALTGTTATPQAL